MKTSTILIATAAVLGAASGEKCKYLTEIAPLLHTPKLMAQMVGCHFSSGYNMMPPKAMPTPEQQWSMCSECKSLLDNVSAIKWPNCYSTIAGKNQTFTEYFTAISSPCN